jgi:ATP-dependent DNA helicase RecG
VLGIKLGKNTIEELTNKIITNTDHKIYPKVSVEKMDNKDVLVIEVKKSSDLLVLAFGRPFKRIGKSTVRMSKDEYEKTIVEKHREELRFDNQICKSARLDDIDRNKVIEFLKKAKAERGLDISPKLPFKEALMRLKFIQDRRLTNSAVLLFGNNPQDFFIQAEVKCVRFKGTGVTGTMIDMKDIRGNLIDQLIEAEKFIFDHISLTSWIEEGKLERQEKWEYPPKAIREALANAISHRDYRSSSKVQIRIFDDRIEFWNPGRLPEGWTVETLKRKHESMPFNPLIARAFFWIKYIEEVGTGTNKIIDWCKGWGLPEPDFEYAGSSVVITFRKSKLTEEYLLSLELREKEREIIKHIKINKRITSGEIQKMFNVSRDTSSRYLKQLIESGLIERMGTGKLVYYVLKVK